MGYFYLKEHWELRLKPIWIFIFEYITATPGREKRYVYVRVCVYLCIEDVHCNIRTVPIHLDIPVGLCREYQ